MNMHALPEQALSTAIELFADNEQEIMIQAGLGYSPPLDYIEPCLADHPSVIDIPAFSPSGLKSGVDPLG